MAGISLPHVQHEACRYCGEPFTGHPQKKFCSAACKAKKYRKTNPEASRNSIRNCLYKREYGITLEDYDLMLIEQEGKCAVCGSDDPKGKGRFHVDHDHDTGKVRGLLCHYCNIAEGYLSTKACAQLMRYKLKWGGV